MFDWSVISMTVIYLNCLTSCYHVLYSAIIAAKIHDACLSVSFQIGFILAHYGQLINIIAFQIGRLSVALAGQIRQTVPFSHMYLARHYFHFVCKNGHDIDYQYFFWTFVFNFGHTLHCGGNYDWKITTPIRWH